MNYTLSMSLTLSDCFRILNVPQGVKWEQIKRSYYTQAKLYHPDRNPDNPEGESRFKEATLAFKILEAHYKTRNQGLGGTASLIKLDPENDAREEGDPPIEAEPLETPQVQLPKAMLDSVGNDQAFSNFFRRIWDSVLQCERKLFLLDIHKDLTIDAETAANGGIVRVRKGSESYQVKIPSGIWSRMSLRIPGKGESSLLGQKRGDLILNIQVARSDQVFTGESMFFYDIRVPRHSVQNSKVMTLDSVHGAIKFILPRNIASGQAFVLKSHSSAVEAQPTNHIVTIHLI